MKTNVQQDCLKFISAVILCTLTFFSNKSEAKTFASVSHANPINCTACPTGDITLTTQADSTKNVAYTVNQMDASYGAKAPMGTSYISTLESDEPDIACDNNDLISTSTTVTSDPVGITPGIEFQYAFGAPFSDGAGSVRAFPDGTYLVGGRKRSCDDTHDDVLFVKTNCAGEILWSQTYGGTGDERLQWAMNNNFQVDSNGDIIAVGTTTSYGAGGLDFYLIKIDDMGNLLWEKTFGGTADDYGRVVRQTSDGGYIITGLTNSSISQPVQQNDVYVVKTDINGNLEWEKQYHLGGYEDPYTIIEKANGEFLISGRKPPGATVFIMTIDANGNQISVTDIIPGIGFSMESTSDGGFILCGKALNNQDGFLLKLDSDGNSEWSDPVIISGPGDNVAYSVLETESGGFMVAGETNGMGAGAYDVWVFETDPVGNVIWQQTYGGPQNEWATSMQKTDDGDYVISGITASFGAGASDVWLLELDVNVAPNFQLSSQSATVVQRGTQATLILTDYPEDATVVWFAEDQTSILYSDPANNFQPLMDVAGTFYGAYIDPVSGCMSELLEVAVKAYYPLSARVEAYNASCSYANDGSAQVFAYGGAQSIGTGNFIESEERYGFNGIRALLADFNGDGYLDVYSSLYSTSDDVWLNDGDGTYTYQEINYNSIKRGIYATSADFDNDGDMDVYVANATPGTDKVLINDGDGVFTELAQSYGINDSQGADVGDLNGDGNIDIIVTGTGFVVVLLGNGDGTFAQQSNIGTPSYSGRSVKLGDLDNDGDLDAFITNGSGLGATTNPPNPNKVYLNDGNANFTVVAEDYGTNESSWEVALGDIDNDGDLDAVIANWFNVEDQIYLNDGDGTFTESTQNFTPSFSTRGVELGDMDWDGDLDIIFAHMDYYSGTGSASVRYWKNDGTGNFVESVSSYPEAFDIALGDIDRDGDLDVFSCNGYPQPWTGLQHILYNDDGLVTPYAINWSGGSPFQPNIQLNLSQGIKSVMVSDSIGNSETVAFEIFASDPILLETAAIDPSCSTNQDGSAMVSLSGGAPFLIRDQNPPVRVGTSVDYSILLEDMDNDDDLDIVGGTLNRVIGINDGEGNFTELYEASLPEGCYPLLAGDLDGDGIKDLLGVVLNTGNFRYYKGNGDFTFQPPVPYFADGIFRAAQLGDLDNDGDLDLFLANSYARPNYVFMNDGAGNFTQSGNELGSEDTWDVKLGDLDNDGDLDAFTANLGTGDIVWLNDGSGNFSSHFLLPSGISSDYVSLGDLDNDGDLDAVVDCFGYQATRIYFNNGDATFAVSPQLIPNMDRNEVALADLDNDNDLDIVYNKTRHLQPGGHGGIIQLNDGNGFFKEYRINNSGTLISFSTPIKTGDIDGDGDVDIVVNGGYGIAVYFNSPMTYTYQWSNNANSQTTATATNLGAGTYAVTAKDFRGCSTNTSVTLNAPSLNCINPIIIYTSSNPGSCEVTINISDILEDSTACSGLLTYTITDAIGNIIAAGMPPFTFDAPDYINETLTVEVSLIGGDIQCTSSLTIVDDVAPLANCVVLYTAALDENGSVIINPTDIDDGSFDLCGDVALSLDNNTFTCEDIGLQIVTLTVTDESGNNSQCNTIVTIEDHTAPQALCVGNFTLALDGNGNASITPEDIDDGSFDVCGDVSLSLDSTDFDCDDLGLQMVTLTVTDESGNAAQCSVEVSVIDNLPPDFTVPADITISCDQNPNDTGLTGFPSNVSDNCDPNPNIVFTDTIETNGCNQTITRTWTATDNTNNSNTQIQVIMIVDTETPQLACIQSLVFSCSDFNGAASIPIPTVSDNCDTNPSLTFTESSSQTNNGSCTDYSYKIVRIWVATDNCGNSSMCEQVIDIQDTEAPVATCPPDNNTLTCYQNLPAAATSAEGFIAMGGQLSDNCAASSEITLISSQDSNNGSACPGNQLTVLRTYYFVDPCGNTSTCTQTFSYLPSTQGPVITDILPTCYKYCGSLANPEESDVTYETDCHLGATVYITGPEINGEADCPGTAYVYTYTVTDDCGRSTSAIRSFIIGNEGPSITCPPFNLILECNDPNNAAYIQTHLEQTTVNSSCGMDVQLMHNYQYEQPVNCVSSQVVTFTATDACGRTATCSTTITIIDAEPPVIQEVPSSNCNIVECGDDNDYWFNFWLEYMLDNLTAIDNCSEVSWDMIPSNPVLNEICDESGNSVTKVTFVASDNCGNSEEYVGVFILENNHPAKFSYLPPSDTLVCPDTIIFGIPELTEVCQTSLTYIDTIILDSQYIHHQRIWTALDECGGISSSASQTISVFDSIAPIVSGHDGLTLIIENALPEPMVVLTAAQLNNGSYDPACSGICDLRIRKHDSLLPNNTPPDTNFVLFTCEELGQNMVELWVMDCVGNWAFSVFRVLVVDDLHLALCNKPPHDGEKEKSLLSATGVGQNQFQPGTNENQFQPNHSEGFYLYQNRPNPFGEVTVIGFQLAISEAIRLSIYDVAGRLVDVYEGYYEKGYNEIRIEASTYPKHSVLYYQLITPTQQATRKMIIE